MLVNSQEGEPCAGAKGLLDALAAESGPGPEVRLLLDNDAVHEADQHKRAGLSAYV